uniref:Peroxidase n=1 Tax=Panagrolaimus sp. ES5 TaxID=591445 RepID=A0AC34GJ19_9BILA
MTNDPAEIPGLKLSTEFRGKFLKSRTSKVGLDLATIAITQSRDHGLPSYTQMRRQCGLSRFYTFHDLKKEFINETYASTLAQYYESVDDIDLLIGVLAEKPKKGSFIGSTLSCIIGNQMYRTKAGDRYWYENYFAASAFTDDKLSQIRSTTLSKLICSVTKTENIQVSSFLLPDNFDNSPIDCKSTAFKGFDLSLWKDTQNDLQLPITHE